MNLRWITEGTATGSTALLFNSIGDRTSPRTVGAAHGKVARNRSALDQALAEGRSEGALARKAAVSAANRFVERCAYLFIVTPDIYATDQSGVAFDFRAKARPAGVLLLFAADGSAMCIVRSLGRTSRKAYPDPGELPDYFLRSALLELQEWPQRHSLHYRQMKS